MRTMYFSRIILAIGIARSERKKDLDIEIHNENVPA